MIEPDTLYAYAHGSDLADIADFLQAALDEFVDSRDWFCDAKVVNQRAPQAQSSAGDLPDWDLGVNLALPKGNLAQGVFADTAALDVSSSSGLPSLPSGPPRTSSASTPQTLVTQISCADSKVPEADQQVAAAGFFSCHIFLATIQAHCACTVGVGCSRT